MKKGTLTLIVLALVALSVGGCSKSSKDPGIGVVTGRFVGNSGPSGVTLPLPGTVYVHKSKASGRVLAQGQSDDGGQFRIEVSAGKGYVLTGKSSLFTVGTPGHACQSSRFNVRAGYQITITLFCTMK